MKFIVDAQLPPALAQSLTSLGHDAEHVSNVGLLEAADQSIRQYAADHNLVLITKAEDFIASLFWQRNHPAVIWLRGGNCSNQALLDWFPPILPKLLLRLQEGEKLIELV